MGESTKIEWCDHTFNPWWGCVKVSPGCENCYAEGLSKRFGNNIWGPPKTTSRRLFGDKHWREVEQWDAAAEREGVRKKVFCASMADVFEDHPAVTVERNRLLATIEGTPNLQWLLLTKRPENVMPMIATYTARYLRETSSSWLEGLGDRVWIGTSVEDQKRADERIPELLAIPAAVRFLSVEPLLGPINLTEVIRQEDLAYIDALSGEVHYKDIPSRWRGSSVDWVIVGGESGPGARPLKEEWVRQIKMETMDAGVAFFMKQMGSVWAKEMGYKGKGGELEELPFDLRIRDFPSTVNAMTEKG